MNITVEDLHAWAERRVGDEEEAIWEYLSEITLGPTDAIWEYWCDPTNVDTFAQTGMDGAHFGVFDASDGKRPVVLIAPDAHDRPCMILGESLYEFLCLGCQVGYGLLVELPHQPVQIVKRIQEGEHSGGREAKILAALREEFSLAPWPKETVGNRLFELQELYLHELDMPDN